MPDNKPIQLVVAIAFSLFVTLTTTAAQTEHVLYSFDKTPTSGNEPWAGLVMDAAGNLYGTTEFGGAGGLYGGGIVFELERTTGGGWAEKTLHSFGSGEDGKGPLASLILDAAGNLYSTTSGGGVHGGGTVFELSPEAGGQWKETLLHSFGSGTDGSSPQAPLIFDASGNLYGTASAGGAYGGGIAFELAPETGGRWSETVLYSFNNNGVDGYFPVAGLTSDAEGNLYGTTKRGGTGTGCGGGPPDDCGTVFELVSKTKEKILHNFTNDGTDGNDPVASLIFDNAGNLYGTCVRGAGIVFELTPESNGAWTETVVHSFAGDGDGAFPESGLIFDSAHDLYGTTSTGGNGGLGGTVFELKPVSGGWSETILYNFGQPPGAFDPAGSLILDSGGNLYGTTVAGGPNGSVVNGGTVFEIRR